MQSKKQSLIETSLQVLTDLALNITVAAPLAYFFHNVKTDVISELIIIMTIINFVKSYFVRRLGNYGDELKKRICQKFKKTMRSIKSKNYRYTGYHEGTLE